MSPRLKKASDRTFSYGLAAFNPGESVAELVARADAALYERKRSASAVHPASLASEPDRGGEGIAIPRTPSGPEQNEGRWRRFGHWLTRLFR